jgi:hypothetical protein
MTTQPETPYSEEAARELLDLLRRLPDHRREQAWDVITRAVDLAER